MAFCSSCGAQIADNERFCAKCGADQTAKAGGAPAAVAPAPVAAPPPPAAPPPYGAPPPGAVPPQPFMAPPPGALPHMPFVAPGQVPMPVQAPAKKSGMMWLGVIVIAVIGWYYYTHHMQPQGQQPGNQPTQPGQQPGNQPGQQPGNPGQQPGNPGQGGNNQALLQQQQFTFNPQPQNGYVEITQASWTNNSNVTIQTATLECGQFDANNQVIQGSLQQTMLNGPLGPGQNMTYPAFQMGAVQQGVQTVKCGIVAVTPATQ